MSPYVVLYMNTFYLKIVQSIRRRRWWRMFIYIHELNDIDSESEYERCGKDNKQKKKNKRDK